MIGMLSALFSAHDRLRICFHPRQGICVGFSAVDAGQLLRRRRAGRRRSGSASRPLRRGLRRAGRRAGRPSPRPARGSGRRRSRAAACRPWRPAPRRGRGCARRRCRGGCPSPRQSPGQLPVSLREAAGARPGRWRPSWRRRSRPGWPRPARPPVIEYSLCSALGASSSSATCFHTCLKTAPDTSARPGCRRSDRSAGRRAWLPCSTLPPRPDVLAPAPDDHQTDHQSHQGQRPRR